MLEALQAFGQTDHNCDPRWTLVGLVNHYQIWRRLWTRSFVRSLVRPFTCSLTHLLLEMVHPLFFIIIIFCLFLFHNSVAVVVQAIHRRSEDPAIPKPRQKASPVSRRKWATFTTTVFRPIMQSVPCTPLQLSHWPAICPSTRSNGRSIWRPMTSKYDIQTNADSLEQIYFVSLTSSCSLIPNVDSVSRLGKCRLMERKIAFFYMFRPIYFWKNLKQEWLLAF